MQLRRLEDLDLSGKKVFLRLDLNVPIKGGKIGDDTRIVAALPTIKYIMEHASRLAIASHLGRPKGVPVTHRAFLTNAENASRCFGIPHDAGEDLRTLVSAPLFHVTACNSQLVLAHYVGGSAVILPTLDVSELLKAIPKHQISFLVTVPAVFALMLRNPGFADTDVDSVRWLG